MAWPSCWAAGDGAQEQAAMLAGRLPAAGLFGLFVEQHSRADQFRFRERGRWQPEHQYQANEPTVTC
jgi:hypothetical protein